MGANVDDSTNAHGNGAGMLLKTPNDTVIEHSMQFGFQAINNEVEYESLITGLKLAQSFEKSRIKVFSNSQLVINQINRKYATKDMKMSIYLSKVKKLQSEFKEFSIELLPRSKNSNMDALTKLRSSIGSEFRRTILIEILAHPSIINKEDICSADKKGETWIDPIISFIQMNPSC